MNFDDAFEKLIGHEGGYVNHPKDPGGETKYGISKRSYPREDIANMSLERAKVIYQQDFWWKAGCDTVPHGVKFSLFDMAVNSSPTVAIKTMQKAVGVEADGLIGPVTQRALGALHPAAFIAKFNGHRLQYLSSLPTWPSFGRGWANRIAMNLMEV